MRDVPFLAAEKGQRTMFPRSRTNDPAEFAQAVSELRAALRAQLAHLRELVDEAKQTIAQLPPASFHERRKMERRKMDRRRRRR